MNRSFWRSTFLFLSLSPLCLALWLTAGVSRPGIAQDAPRELADHPRVSDAVRVWEEWVEYQATMDAVPGVSLGIVHDQELIAASAFGFANPEAMLPATPETLYSICSISKLFTSVAVMQQRDEGRLRLGDPVAEHLPWFAIQDAHPDDGPITIAGILTHSAGLPRESDYPYWTGPEGYPFPTHEEIVARIDEQATLYPSSRYFQYSNLGLTLAGEIVSTVSGQPFDEYVRARILDPLDMKNTFTEVPIDLRGTRLAIGHTARRRDGSRPVAEPFQTRGIAPAAGFASNVGDLARFAMWQNRLLSQGGEEVLRASTLREMHRVWWVDPDWETTWGLGFSVSREGDRTFVSHGGGCPGYYTHFRLEPKSKIAAVVLTNAIGSEVGLYTLRAFDLIAPAIAKALDEKDEVPERDPDLDRYTGVYESIWGQSAIVRWEDGLAYVGLGSRDPANALFKLKETGDHTFRLVRKDDEDVLGQEFVFEVADDGTVTRYLTHSNWSAKIR
jgi:CubicO group peptidase (beta-lactamase class C family)